MMRVARLLTVVFALSLAVTPRVRAATFVVTSTADAVDAVPGDGVCATAAATCTLRAAIQEANALSGADTITLPAGVYTLALLGAGEDASATGDLDITGDLTITGAPSGQTTVIANGIDRVFDIFAPAVVTLSRLTIQSGNATGTDMPGGGIRNAGALTLTLAALRSSVAGGDGGGLANRAGGSAQLTNVTITGNSSTGARGGGIANDRGGTLQLVNVTLSGNSATQGGGIDNIGSAQVVNTIVANSPMGGTCTGAAVTSLGHNLDSGTTCLFSQPSDLQNKDPKLDTLFDAGSTFVFPLKAGSPAIDAGDNVNCPPSDQRGQLRPADGNGDGIYACDIGAYEVTGPVLPTPTASTTGTATSTPSPQTPTNTATPTGTPAAGSISLSRVIGHPGEQVVVAATLSTKGAAIARTQNDIAFDSANAPIAALPNAAPDCTVNPQIAKDGTSFAFQPQGCSGAACTSVHAAVLSTTNTTAIPDGVLYTCKANIAPSAAAGEYPLTISAVILESPNGQPLPNPIGSSGAIVVVVPTPTRTPGAADCCQCSSPLVCGPATGGCGSCTVVFGATCDGSSGQCVAFTATPTGSPTASASQTPTATRTATPTLTPSSTPTLAPVATSTATATTTTATATATQTVTAIASESSTPTPTTPPTTTPTATATLTPTETMTVLVTPTATPTASDTATATGTVTATVTATPTPTATATASHSATPTETTTATATASPSATPSASATPVACAGDCDHSGEVTITDIVTLVNIALESAPVTACPAGNLNGDGQISVDEILAALGNSLHGCPMP